MPRGRTNPEFLNGVPELVVLRMLDDRAMHGYELVKAIRATTGDTFRFGEGVIYPILHRLDGQGLLRARSETVRGRERITYRTTTKGRRRLAASAERWRAVASTLETLLDGSALQGDPADAPVR